MKGPKLAAFLLFLLAVTAAFSFLLTGCRSSPEVTIRSFKASQPGPVVEVNKGVGITVDVENPRNLPLAYRFTTNLGGQVRRTGEDDFAPTYVAPARPGTENIGVEVLSAGKVLARSSLQIEVVPAAVVVVLPTPPVPPVSPAPTPQPATPVSTSAPAPLPPTPSPSPRPSPVPPTAKPVSPTETARLPSPSPAASTVAPTSPPTSPTLARPVTIDLNPALFVIQGGNEFFLDTTREGAVPGLKVDNGVDLTSYDLEFTFRGGDGKQVQLWYKNQNYANVYSKPYAIAANRPVRFNPISDPKDVNEFSDFTHIYALGAKVFGGVGAATIGPARLIARVTPPAIASLAPRPEDCGPSSQCIITINGTWTRVEARGGLKLYVLVRPMPQDPSQAYWVQAPPIVDQEGQWSSSGVYIGQPGDHAGLPFNVCAVATGLNLTSGQQLGDLPSGPSSCIDVTRGRP